MDKARILGQIRALQRISDELAGMITAIPENSKVIEIKPAPGDGGAPEIMTARQVQAFLGIGESTFYAWIKDGRLPQGEVWGPKTKRWRKKDLLEHNKSKSK